MGSHPILASSPEEEIPFMVNWLTTLCGILTAIGVAGAGIPACTPEMTAVCMPAEYKWIFAVLAGLGAVSLGAAAKDARVHSTIDEVEKSTIEKQVDDARKQVAKQDGISAVRKDITKDIREGREK